MLKFAEKGSVVWNRDHSISGVTTGSQHRCQMEGCTGVRVSVSWPDGRRTYPCSKGLKTLPDNQFQIG